MPEVKLLSPKLKHLHIAQTTLIEVVQGVSHVGKFGVY